jgi:6-phosphogluconolactonase (cycloisomerase 2 family)
MYDRKRPLLSFVVLLLAAVGLLAGCDANSPLTPETAEPSDEVTVSDQLPTPGELMAMLDSVAQTAALNAAFTRAPMPAPGAVFVLSNDPRGNEVIAFRRNASGEVQRRDSFPTGGLGSGDGLGGTSNPLVVSDDNRYLFAVNGGSDEVSSFRINGDDLELVSRVPSGAFRPISVAASGPVVYVLNAGRDGVPGLLTGFRVDGDGRLAPIPDARLPLNPGAADPSQVDFSPDGRLLVVTDKPTNTITTYRVGADGVAGPPNPQPSSGMTPFGFDLTGELLLVSEAAGGAEDASSISSYRLGADGTLEVLTASLSTTESAACWVEVTENGRYAYTTNTNSGTISGVRIADDGTLSLLDEDGITVVTGGEPLDVEMVGSDFLYVHVRETNELLAYRVEQGTGALTPIETQGTRGLPPTAVGVAVTGASAARTAFGDRRFVALMTGGQQVPDRVETAGSGIAGFRVNGSGTTALYAIALVNIEDVTQAHTHLAPAGENGPVTAFLLRFTENIDGSGGGDPLTPAGVFLEFGLVTADGVVGPIAGDFAALIESFAAGDAYVNVHTVDNPPGEIRGQIGDITAFVQ